jgi:hypothetical protein
MTGSFVYVIEGQAGHHKIGVSTDPIARLAQLQTGSPVPLRFVYIGVTSSTGYAIESRAHELLDAYRKQGEWFLVPASIAIGATLEAAMRLGEPIQQCRPEIVPAIIRAASQPAPSVTVTTQYGWLPYCIAIGVPMAGLFLGFSIGVVVILAAFALFIGFVQVRLR